MKTLKITFILLMVFAGLNTFAQSKKGTETVTIKSSMVCDMCKKTITHALAFEKGVKKVAINVEKQEVKISFNPEKTTIAEIKNAIAKSGYDADDIPAEMKAYNQLEDCCKKTNAIHK